jgi:hypothetical protein
MAKVAKAGRCQRCGDMLHGPRFLNSMTKLKAGFVDHYVCTDCLSVEEMAEMVIREATTDVGITRDGRYLSRGALDAKLLNSYLSGLCRRCAWCPPSCSLRAAPEESRGGPTRSGNW